MCREYEWHKFFRPLVVFCQLSSSLLFIPSTSYTHRLNSPRLHWDLWSSRVVWTRDIYHHHDFQHVFSLSLSLSLSLDWIVLCIEEFHCLIMTWSIPPPFYVCCIWRPSGRDFFFRKIEAFRKRGIFCLWHLLKFTMFFWHLPSTFAFFFIESIVGPDKSRCCEQRRCGKCTRP